LSSKKEREQRNLPRVPENEHIGGIDNLSVKVQTPPRNKFQGS